LTSQQTRQRHVVPRTPARPLLPGVLLLAVGAAFAGLAVLPASATGVAQRVSAANVLAPVELAPGDHLAAASAVPPTGENPPPVAAAGAVAPELLAPPPPAPPPARASRDREPTGATTTVGGARFARPGNGRLTSPYGPRWGRLHSGVDLAAGMGSPIRAVTKATVLSSGIDGGYGQSIRLLHPDGTVTLYGHLSSLLVKPGNKVAAGQQIGREGNTGQSTGPHLHFEVHVDGVPVNPARWLAQRGISI
jgi:murein DD-endopeptidase MepM/ murein hydrolase activator NlpD